MNNKSVIDQLKQYGVAAVHIEGRHVDMIRGIPVKATFRLPIMMDPKKLKKGSKVAILSTDQKTAFICKVAKLDFIGTDTPVLELDNQKLVHLN